MPCSRDERAVAPGLCLYPFSSRDSCGYALGLAQVKDLLTFPRTQLSAEFHGQNEGKNEGEAR